MCVWNEPKRMISRGIALIFNGNFARWTILMGKFRMLSDIGSEREREWQNPEINFQQYSVLCVWSSNSNPGYFRFDGSGKNIDTPKRKSVTVIISIHRSNMYTNAHTHAIWLMNFDRGEEENSESKIRTTERDAHIERERERRKRKKIRSEQMMSVSIDVMRCDGVLLIFFLSLRSYIGKWKL